MPEEPERKEGLSQGRTYSLRRKVGDGYVSKKSAAKICLLKSRDPRGEEKTTLRAGPKRKEWYVERSLKKKTRR